MRPRDGSRIVNLRVKALIHIFERWAHEFKHFCSDFMSVIAPTAPLLDTAELFSEVLLVEDDPAHARLIERAVSPLLGNIAHVTSIRSAIEHLQQNFIELILCDFHLADSDALELLRVLREAGVATPVII